MKCITHRWHLVNEIKQRNNYPAIFRFVCDKCGKTKLVESTGMITI